MNDSGTSAIYIQSNLDYPNAFGQVQDLSVRISKKVRIIESVYSMYG